MNRTIFNIALFVLISVPAIFSGCRDSNSKTQNNRVDMESIQNDNLEKATFGSGCFWCTEAVFLRVEGVKSVVSGYAGGTKENPSYEQVCTGNTGHAEVVQVTYDPKVISYDEVLKIFWQTHDPTTLNKQGADVGTQYRSVVFYHNDEQKEKAERYKKELDKSGAWKDPIVTQIVPFTKFYKAEDYHQNYFANNPEKGYCAFVIAPKVEKFEKVFKEKLKKN
jgi:peptide-methionine (S)-S-oxide reductase